MTLVNVNRFHCTNTNLQTSVQYKQQNTQHHNSQQHPAASATQQQHLTHQLSSQHHDSSPTHSNIHHQCHHQRRRSSGFDNSSDVSSFTSSCSSTSSPALFADKSRLIRLKRNDNDQTQCKSLGFSIRGGKFIAPRPPACLPVCQTFLSSSSTPKIFFLPEISVILSLFCFVLFVYV